MMSSMRFILHTTIFSHQLKRVSIFVRKIAVKSGPNSSCVLTEKKDKQTSSLFQKRTNNKKQKVKPYAYVNWFQFEQWS